METHNKTLLNVLCQITDTDEMRVFLDQLLTEKEVKEMTNRMLIFEMLLKKKSQREIAAQLGVGIATVTRGALALNQDTAGILQKRLS